MSPIATIYLYYLRPFHFVDDLVKGIVRLMDQEETLGLVNIDYLNVLTTLLSSRSSYVARCSPAHNPGFSCHRVRYETTEAL